jgi:PKHD-type hydroxylase
MANYIFAPSPTFGISEHPFVTWTDAFTNEEIDKIVEYCDSLTKTKATVGGLSEEDALKDIRDSDVAWVTYEEDSRWIYDRLAWLSRTINGQFYKFDLYGFNEPLQFTVYEGDNEGHYTWHVDSGITDSAAPPRKLSLVLQLSDPEDYEGGSLEVYTSSKPQQVAKQKGLITAFPSYTLHRVTPVTSGIRKTIVVWVSGPSFK